MTTFRRRLPKTSHAPALIAGFAAGMIAVYGLVGGPGLDQPLVGLRVADAGHGGHSVHLKNRGTPAWMRELQARQTEQAPIALDSTAPSFWI